MLRLRQRILIVLAVAAVLASGAFHRAVAQRMRPPRVYNPHAYNNTRRMTNNRAAARAAVRKRHKAKAKRRRARRASADRL